MNVQYILISLTFVQLWKCTDIYIKVDVNIVTASSLKFITHIMEHQQVVLHATIL